MVSSTQDTKKKLPEVEVWKFMLSNSRPVVALFSVLVYG